MLESMVEPKQAHNAAQRTAVSVVVPVYNEELNVQRMYESLAAVLNETAEFIFVDDGSNDNTAQVARQWGVQHIVLHRRNRGLAAAFQSGIDAALAARSRDPLSLIANAALGWVHYYAGEPRRARAAHGVESPRNRRRLPPDRA